MFKIVFRGLLALLVISVLSWLYYDGYIVQRYRYIDPKNFHIPQRDVYVFEGVSGPAEPTQKPIKILAKSEDFKAGSTSRLAILLTEESSNWLALAHGLKSIGIPFVITRDYKVALQHKVVFVYPFIEKSLPAEELQSLIHFPEKGGTLIAQDIRNPELFNIFGFKSLNSISDKTSRLYLDPEFVVTKIFTFPEEKMINIGNNNGYTVAQNSFDKLAEKPIAIYENGKAAITQKTYPNGHAYALGLDLSALISTGYDDRQYDSRGKGFTDTYANHYRPTMDVLLNLIKNIYVQGQGDAVTLSPVPYGKSLAVIITHDLCFSEAMKGSPYYMDVELKHGIKATYFVQTKYITDLNDIAFFNEENLPVLRKLLDNGMELGSHSVSHSYDFDKFPVGTGNEHYVKYQPYIYPIPGEKRDAVEDFYIQDSVTIGGSVFGELRVSRFLLEHFFPQKVVSFRPGYLTSPQNLPQMLAATGFLYTSSTPANVALTHLPFKLFFNKDYYQDKQSDVNVYQFPLAVEDQTLPPLYQRLPDTIELAKKISHFGGLYVLLIHPNVDKNKIKFLDLFLTKIQTGFSAWFGTLAQFGDWWSARDQIEVDVFNRGQGQFTVKLKVPKPISGLTLNLPKNFIYKSSSLMPINLKQEGDKLIINQKISGFINLEFQLNTEKSNSKTIKLR